MKLQANVSHNAPTIPAEGNTHVSLNIKKEALFEVVVNNTEISDGKTATVDCNYTASDGAASVWNDRNTTLVLTAPETVPSDLTLTADVDGSKTRYSMNASKQFIIPLGGLGGKNAKLTLNSDLFGSTEETFEFTAKWYVSQSSADKAPLNGYLANSDTVSIGFTCKKDSVPSLRIDGTQHLSHAGETLEVTVNFAGISTEGTITAYLQGKSDGKYIDTGAKITIENSCNQKAITFNMGQMEKGSYRVLVIVQVSGANILHVPYYFVIA